MTHVFQGLKPPTTCGGSMNLPMASHGQDVVGVPDGDRHVPPAEGVAEKLQMAEATVGI